MLGATGVAIFYAPMSLVCYRSNHEVSSLYEVKDLFPWKILTKMVKQYLLKVGK